MVRIPRRQWAVAALCVAGTLVPQLGCPAAARGQQSDEDVNGEVVARLAAGHALIIEARQGLVLVSVGAELEPASWPPLLVPLGGHSAAVIFGAVDWSEPPGERHRLRLDQQVVRMGAPIITAQPRLQPEPNLDRGWVERLGLELLEPLRGVAARLHARLDVPDDWVLLDVLVVTRSEGQTSAWELRYRLRQRALRGDFWQTQVLRPQIEQRLPDKQVGSVLEVAYPGELAGPALPRLIEAADEPTRKQLLAGRSRRLPLEEVLGVLKPALRTSAASGHALLAQLTDAHGFDWVYAPPDWLRPPDEKTESGAPTLRRPQPQ